MDALSDDLTKPLGVDQAARRGWRLGPPIARALAGVLGAVVAGLVAYALFANDPFGGEPYALVPIEGAGPEARVLPAPSREEGRRNDAPREPAPIESRARSSAAELEAASGVSVVRPQGAGAPGSLIIQVPDDLGGKLRPAPDKRLVERTREGALPKIGPDGSRPSEVYARPAALPAGNARTMPRVAIVVAGLGVGQAVTTDAVAKLPPAVTLAFTPYGSDVERDAARARDEGHEVMLQAPMEPFDYPDNDPGPYTLTVRAKADDNIARLHWAMARFPGYIGLINFMGAKLTADETALAPILREIGGRGLVFVDDGSSPRSLVATVGPNVDLSTARADLVLDGVPRPEAVDRQLERLEQMARQRGFALGSASALPVTLDRIARWAKALEMRGVLLVPVSSAFAKEARR